MQPSEVGGSWKQEARLPRNVGSARATSREGIGSTEADWEMGVLAAAAPAPVELDSGSSVAVPGLQRH